MPFLRKRGVVAIQIVALVPLVVLLVVLLVRSIKIIVMKIKRFAEAINQNSMETTDMFLEKMKLSDILEKNPQLILTLPRFNIGLGFGEQSVKRVCEKNNLSVSLFLLICNVYTYKNYLPSGETLASLDGRALIDYLQASHDYYFNKRLRHIEGHIKRIADHCGETGVELKKFFTEYRQEVENHFYKEESVVFPYIINLLRGVSHKKIIIEDYLKEHTNVEDKLNDLTNIIVKYLPPHILPEERISVWFDLIQVYQDMNTHAKIEEKILVPYVRILESRKNG